ncbi:MAG: glycine cleavage system protein H [Bryobacteraceae bacterium]|nr:glycine cleavage system protein H [Bryobacteraceae bacterium]
MFPNVSGWSWTPLHVTFVTIFLTVAAVMAGTLLLAAWRAWRDVRRGRAESIRWHSEFEDLPLADRTCRHVLTNEFLHRTCDQGFDCRECATHARWTENHPAAAAVDFEVAGLKYPADRMYHRGHTWVKVEDGGTLLIGPDALSERMFGRIGSLTLPAVGTTLHACAPAWTIRSRGDTFRVLSPVDGEVVEQGGPEQACYLRVRPSEHPPALTHLLRGSEVRPWVLRELERLQLLVSPGLPSLADGGVLAEDLPAMSPDVNWPAVWGQMLLEP